MQVLNYRSPPILQEGTNIPTSISNMDSIKQQIQQPIITVINDTLGAVNETIQQVMEKVPVEKTLESLSQTHFEDEWNLLYLVRILFYIFVILKVIEFVFTKRRKMDIQERVYRKYIFSHGELIRQFNEDERKVMDTTLKNTIKNATIDKIRPNLRKNSNKKVNFFQTKNQYFEPKRYPQSNDELSPLQVFLSKPVQIQPPADDPKQEAEQTEFQIIESIDQSHNTDEQSGIFFQNSKDESHIIQNTPQGSTMEFVANQEKLEKIEINV